jgi:pimeloyl-ACP methyl ester carboxylesterase
MPFLPHHDLVVAEGPPPRAWALMTHGIYGSGANWRTIARRIVERRPGWGCLLVDLRMHGRSQEAPPPHTVANAAADLAALVGALGEGGKVVRVVCGHSFGGKVALAHRALAAPSLAQTWVLDASASARPGTIDADEATVPQVLRLLEAMPARLDSREQFVARVTAAGLHAGLGQWLAMNLHRAPDGSYALRLDLAAIRALLTDYYATDLWGVLGDPGLPGDVEIVIAGKSTAVSSEDRTRLEALAAGPMAGRLGVHLLPEASHWLHIDAQAELLELVAGRLPEA